jgi:glutamine synthetase
MLEYSNFINFVGAIMGTFVNNSEEFFKFCEENEVKFVDFRFTDIDGVWHHLTYNVKAVNADLLVKGMPFDGSSIPSWQPINMSDMILKPDVETAFLDPFTADSTIIVFCDVYDIYKEQAYEKCPRSIAKKALEYLKEANLGDMAYFGPENEFFIFDDVKVKDSINCQYYEVDTSEGDWNRATDYADSFNSGHRPGTKGGYFPVAPVDSMVDLRAEMSQVLEEVGLEVSLFHHEVAQGQGEIGVKFGTLVEAADNVQKLKYVIKNVAHFNGKSATFMPKPLYGDNGNGMHCHQSIWKDGKNLFAGDVYAGLSQTALHYIGGVLKHAKAVAAFTNASTNSYKRLIPGFEAPSILTYSAQNRSASCRIPFVEGDAARRAEFRFPDSTANPYLAFTALLCAGLDGIQNKIDPGEPMEDDLFELTLDEIRERGINQMPHTLREALEAMIASKGVFNKVMTNEFLDTYQHHKFENQVIPDEARPTAYEVKSTYSC